MEAVRSSCMVSLYPIKGLISSLNVSSHGHVTDQIKNAFPPESFPLKIFRLEKFWRKGGFRHFFPPENNNNFQQFSAGNGISAGCPSSMWRGFQHRKEFHLHLLLLSNPTENPQRRVYPQNPGSPQITSCQGSETPQEK